VLVLQAHALPAAQERWWQHIQNTFFIMHAVLSGWRCARRTRWPCRSRRQQRRSACGSAYSTRLPVHSLLSGWRSAQPYQMVVPQQAAAVQQAAATQAAATAAPAAPSAAGQTLPSAARPAGAAVLFEYHCVGVQNYTSRAAPFLRVARATGN